MVSVIVPIYNAEKFLCRCIESIISQTYNNLEIILIDDGSTDSSGIICDDYKKRDSRIKVVHQENHGLVYSRFIGVQESNGNWGFFVDADDYIPNEAIHALIYDSEGYDLVSGFSKIILPEHNLTTVFPKHIKEEGVFSKDEFIKALLLGTRLASIWRQLISMKVLKKAIYGIPQNITISEDLILNLKIGIEINKVKGISNHVYNYFYYSTNMTNSIQVTLSYIDLIDTTMESILQNKNEYQQYFFYYRINVIAKHITENDVTKTQLVKNTLKTKSLYKKKIKQQVLLSLCKIQSTSTRIVIWKFYLAIEKKAYHLYKLVKTLIKK